MKRSPDIIGIFRLLATCGRSHAAYSGYRPAHKLHDNYLSSGEHFYPATGAVEVGSSASVEVKLITPNVYPKSIWVGRILEVFEGSRLVGTIEVTEVRNPVLLGSSESFRAVWEQPPGLARDGV